MASKQLKIDSLELDLENPRITLATDQRDAMQKIITEQNFRLINLAESIAEKGFNPMDRCLVLGSGQRVGRFIVLEGNRRVLSVKLLKNPALVNTLEMPDAHKKRLLKAAKNFDLKKIEPVDCYEVATRAEGKEWILQRHNGADEGRGIVGWSPIAGSRFHGRYPALQAHDFVTEYGELTDEQKELITFRRKIHLGLKWQSTSPWYRASVGGEED